MVTDEIYFASRSGLGRGERFAGFEKRLQAGQEHRPAVAHHRRRSASGLEVVMYDCQFDHLPDRFDIEGDP